MSQEAAQALLQNIYTFVRIADQAALTTVGSWDVQSLHNALQWAAYCQQIAAQVTGRKLEPLLEGRLEEMSQLLGRPQTQQLTIGFLSKAVDTLVERNLAAAKCKLHFQATVTSQIKELGLLLASGRSEADFPQNNASVITCVRLFLEQLTLWFEMEQDPDRFEKQLKNVAVHLSQLPYGWSVLVMCLSVNMSKVEMEHREGLRYVQHLIAAWIVSHHQISGPACPLWQVAPSLLMQAAEHNVQFCDWYLSALVQLTESLQADYTESHSTPVTLHSHLYGWSNPKMSNKCVFNDILQLFSQLLSADSAVKNKTLSILTSKTAGCAFSVWTDLTKSLITKFT
ncbi:hypothetical protein BaRGS_00012218 [Batillaria attramentaria]|uniref:Uncharacterized protein n=1 Tax=Batillaria attramentaria TaxID=370345 RepID=A0ABD0LB98_9CAEN